MASRGPGVPYCEAGPRGAAAATLGPAGTGDHPYLPPKSAPSTQTKGPDGGLTASTYSYLGGEGQETEGRRSLAPRPPPFNV